LFTVMQVRTRFLFKTDISNVESVSDQAHCSPSWKSTDMYKHDRTMKEEATQLIVVCCHGIWLGGPSLGADEAEWLIAPFQHGEMPTFTEHIKAGLTLLSFTPGSLLIFSG
jgi:hypothetical protein